MPNISTLNLSTSLPRFCTFPNCNMLLTFHVPILIFFLSCIVPSSMFIFLPVADFPTLSWSLNRERGPCFTGRRSSLHGSPLGFILHDAVWSQFRWQVPQSFHLAVGRPSS